MTARVLEYEEWGRMPEYMDPVMVNMRPGTSRVCVVEHEGEIVARWLLYPVLFAEDLYIHPDYRRKVSVGRKLWRLMHRAAAELGFRHLVSAPQEDAKALWTHPALQAEVMPMMVVFPVQGGQ